MMAERATSAQPIPWQERNQGALVAEFAALRRRLDGEAAAVRPGDGMAGGSSTAIEVLAEIFELSAFERELLLLLAGVEMDSALAERVRELADGKRGVTFSLAMATLASPHWSALAATSPLRKWKLITLEAGHGLTTAPLQIEERVLHYLAGTNCIDARLEDVLFRKPPPEWMDDDHFKLGNEILRRLEAGEVCGVVHLCGDDALGQEGVASLVAHRSGQQLYVLRYEDTPAAGAELEQFLHLWIREQQLLPAMLLLQWGSEAPSVAAKQLAERVPGTLMIASREPLRLHRAVKCHQVDKPEPAAQLRLWQDALGAAAEQADGVLDQVAQQFRLSAETIVTIAGSMEAESAQPLSARLWSACRVHSRPRLELLAEQIVPTAKWDDLVLPEAQTLVLRQLAAQSRNRMTVFETWGFAANGRRGLGLSALFSGPSGTGKTLAAEVLAAELHLDLYRIDLSAVVSKYIGETEKNLKHVFDAAEAGGCMLLFDEADALFGKRAEVKDSHDRYANIEVGYLLQRMESFLGLAILTTNMKSTLDKSFQRRLRFTVDFPFPDATQRQEIWTRVFPAPTPTMGLDFGRLAALNMTGGNIRNIALNAAFLAADAKAPVGMAHILQAAQLEAIKTERPIAEMETRGWV
jgi:ATPase family associated with various cellular activities (AAA)